MTTIYYDPAHFGYELVGMLDQEDMSYEFHMLGLWQRISDGSLWWAEDWGCSCPAPFEDYKGPSGSEWIRPLSSTWGEYSAALRDFEANPADKQRFWMLARKPFGANVLVTSDGAVRV